ncbi:Acyl-CoA synthetase (NDP forming) [Roseovarius mucosus DSM 17069]|uniref:Acyl-CoA synthetase (NDP forming) n=1 Tax=Roseovarius mucosus DSM 17069 TaxID=1288298 RepID=A0A0A0HNH0_9RHOB|nr:acetate--CoA ligase family protein [Roseovarius mucosus]KGM87673.1 Acyl-CoA synthetase (NDP forming) [Roseovarius mucosus DSM 17069]
MTQDLSRLLRPASIAVIGGGTWCANLIAQCAAMGFAGPVWPVHPSKPDIGGARAYPTLASLPGVPDAVFVGVNRDATIATVAELRAMGAGGAVCFAAGFLEAEAELGDGAAMQARLLEAAGDMPIIGPNCYGFVNYLDGALLWPDQHGGRRCASGVAILTQSSNIAINLSMQARGLPIAYLMTAGNQAQLGLADLGRALLADPRVTALGLHIEGVGDLRAFEALAEAARAAGKPIVALKSGRSDQARAATQSHTASLAGSGAGAAALLARLGIAQVTSLPQMLETLKLLHFAGPLPGNAVASISCSGGEASLMADTALDHAITLPPLTPSQASALRAALGPRVALANPLDYHTFIWGDVPAMTATFAAALEGPADIGVMIADFPRPDRCDPAAWDCIFEAGAEARRRVGKPLALIATLPDCLSEAMAERAIASGLIPLLGLDDGLTAIAHAAWLGQARATPAPLLLPGPPTRPHTLTEAEAKAALAAHGLRIPQARRATSAAELSEILTAMPLPLVIKAEGLAHKTEAGGVLFLRDAGETPEALAKATAMPCQSWLIEEMVAGPVAELLIGVLRDPAHGFVLTLGAGGILTEILRDTTCLLLPVAEPEIDRALNHLRLAPLLHGYRGQPAADRAAILRAVMAVQDYVITHASCLEEVEINPLLCTASDAVAVDALITKGERP